MHVYLRPTPQLFNSRSNITVRVTEDGETRVAEESTVFDRQRRKTEESE